jgi:hypothetical protein
MLCTKLALWSISLTKKRYTVPVQSISPITRTLSLQFRWPENKANHLPLTTCSRFSFHNTYFTKSKRMKCLAELPELEHEGTTILQNISNIYELIGQCYNQHDVNL